MTIAAETREKLRAHLLVDEGIRLQLYWDCCGRPLRAACTKGAVHPGKLSIGIGRNIEDVGISAMEAYDFNDHDIDRAIVALTKYPWFPDLDPVRQAVLVNLMFNLGPDGLGKFVNTLAAIARHDYAAAARGLQTSLWYRQVQRSRSTRLIAMLTTGAWPEAA